jgi:hypothetical protein
VIGGLILVGRDFPSQQPRQVNPLLVQVGDQTRIVPPVPKGMLMRVDQLDRARRLIAHAVTPSSNSLPACPALKTSIPHRIALSQNHAVISFIALQCPQTGEQLLCVQIILPIDPRTSSMYINSRSKHVST